MHESRGEIIKLTFSKLLKYANNYFKRNKILADTAIKEDCSGIPDSLKIGNKVIVTDYYVHQNIDGELNNFKFKIFTRLNAKNIKFTNVSFEHSVFDGCYLRVGRDSDGTRQFLM